MSDHIPMPYGKTKEELLRLLISEEYGRLPIAATAVIPREITVDHQFCAGKAYLHKISLECVIGESSFSFPITYVENRLAIPAPCFLHINFRPDIPDRYQPTEELVDAGYSVLSFCYLDVSSDDADFADGLAGVIYPGGHRDEQDCGKIGLWAWAALRVMDFAHTLPEVDHSRISVVGHSRLGKTALLAGALDERFLCAFSNDSGCSGAALSRDTKGESVADICRQFPYWFSKSYLKYSGREDELPFDQHFLIAANSPHRVYVSSAAEDFWADPEREYAACRLAAPCFGDHLPKNMPRVGERIHTGHVGYHLRSGRHYLSREDWNYYIEYLRSIY